MPATEAERVETGRKLLALKAQLRGTFKAWVGDNCGFGYRAAAAWMREARAAEIDCKLAELRRQAEANPPMLNLVPSEFATKSTLTDAERQTFMDLAIHGSPLAEGLPRFGSVLGHALFEVPHATFDDLKEVAIRAELYLQGAVLELRALSELLHAYPSAGIVSSCQLAKDKE